MPDRAVIFDMDGVLVDSYAAHLESWNIMLGPRGLAMTEAQFAATFGRTTREIIGQLFPGAAEGDQLAAWDDEKEAAYREVIEREFPEMDGAGDLIRSLHAAGFAMGIGSSGPAENVAVVKRCLPDGGLIAAAVHGMEVTHGKPEPDVFLQVAAKLDLPPARCAVVEDAPAGVEAARRAGMAAVALTGTAPRETLAQRAHVVVESLRELTPARIADLIDTHTTD